MGWGEGVCGSLRVVLVARYAGSEHRKALHKKAFCCQTQGKGCPPTAPPTTPGPTTSLPYDCNAGYHGCYHCLIKQWSVSKLAWCCAHMGRGCPTVAPR